MTVMTAMEMPAMKAIIVTTLMTVVMAITILKAMAMVTGMTVMMAVPGTVTMR